MPGLTGARNAQNLIIGPGWLYLGVDVPASGSPVALTAGVPTNGILVGYTKDGNKFSNTLTQTAIEADESKAPLWEQIATEVLTIEGILMQEIDPAVVTAMLPNATYVTASGLWTFGGLVSIPPAAQTSVCLVAQQRNGTKHVAATLYSAMNVEAFILNITRKAASESPYKFQAQPLGSRPVGDQLGQLWMEP
jgi:hypothetical protein